MKGGNRKLSELEGVCVGLIHQHQPCTAYRVRKMLKDAPSSHWQASAGSVYPLLARLEKEGLIGTNEVSDDGRGTQTLTVLRPGLSALKSWVLMGTDDDLISSVTDPVRSRTFFLNVLGAAQRLKFVEQLIERTQSYLAETAERMEYAKRSNNQFDYLGALGAFKVTEARLEWLYEVKVELDC